MTRLAALVVLTAVAVAIAVVLQRRRPDPPSVPSYRAPSQLDPADFPAITAGQPFVALFASRTCDSCPRVWSTIVSLLSGHSPVKASIAHVRVDVQDDPELHQRYRIDGVPTTVIAGPDGVVLQAFFGPVTAEQLTDALAQLVLTN